MDFIVNHVNMIIPGSLEPCVVVLSGPLFYNRLKIDYLGDIALGNRLEGDFFGDITRMLGKEASILGIFKGFHGSAQ